MFVFPCRSHGNQGIAAGRLSCQICISIGLHIPAFLKGCCLSCQTVYLNCGSADVYINIPQYPILNRYKCANRGILWQLKLHAAVKELGIGASQSGRRITHSSLLKRRSQVLYERDSAASGFPRDVYPVATRGTAPEDACLEHNFTIWAPLPHFPSSFLS